MTSFNSKVDQYIASAADFARPVLAHWRQLVHDTCPDVVEAIKWGIPHYDYKGDFMCVMASYKNHCSFSFLKAELMTDPELSESAKLKPVQRLLGKITKLSELPSDETFVKWLQEAMVLNEKGIKIVALKADKPKTLEVPDLFTRKLAAHPKAKEIFEAKSASFRKDYIVWIAGAKTESTMEKRIEEALEWIAEGKGRFWKYEK